MNVLSKTLLTGLTVSAVISLTGCQTMPMTGHTMNGNGYAEGHHGKMWHGHENMENLTDGQILKVLSTANNGEIMQATAAMPKLQNAQVRNYAQNMINGHTDNEQKGQALGSRLQLVPQVSNTSNKLQYDSNDIINQLNQSMSADKDYMMSQVKVHHKVLRTIDNQLLPNAKNPELRDMLVQTRAAVAMHLQMAEQINSMLR